MKKFLIAVLFSVQASAYAFWVNPRVVINPPRTYAEAYVSNVWARPMVCSGHVNFITRSGFAEYAYFNNQVIYPGQYAVAYAWTNIYNPFMYGNGGVNCYFY